MTDLRSIDTPHGEARLDVRRARSPFVTLLLSHGAGGGVGARDLQALASRLPRQGASVVLLEQPWRVAGRKVATPPPTLDVALVAAARSLRIRTPLVVGGRSAGARSAARSATGLGAVGCLALSFPLHPPGRPEKSRLEELDALSVPVLVVQGDRDPFGMPPAAPGRTVAAIAGDHGLKRDSAALKAAVTEWLVALLPD
jgi:predicted alpha/beta-hydrolase family hydrolase